MTANTETVSSVVAAAKAQLDTKLVTIASRTGGSMPLEWPRVDPKTGKRAVDHWVRDSGGSVIDRVVYRNLEFGTDFCERLDLTDDSHPLETNAEFLERVKDWLANSGDARIRDFQVRLVEDTNFEAEPFPRYNTVKSEAVLAMLEMLMGEDDAANRALLEQCARYELQRGLSAADQEAGYTGPREDVLAGLEHFGVDVGDEAGEGAVTEVED